MSAGYADALHSAWQDTPCMTASNTPERQRRVAAALADVAGTSEVAIRRDAAVLLCEYDAE